MALFDRLGEMFSVALARVLKRPNVFRPRKSHGLSLSLIAVLMCLGATLAAGDVQAQDMSINDVSTGESGQFLFIVTLSHPAGPSGVTFSIATADGTASSLSDYDAQNRIITIASGESYIFFLVSVNDDMMFEPEETFFVNIAGVINANLIDGQGVGRIGNDDALPVAFINVSPSSVVESGTSNLIFTISLDRPSYQDIVFNVSTSGTATSGIDYTGAVSSVTVPAGDTTATITINPSPDALVEADETVTLRL